MVTITRLSRLFALLLALPPVLAGGAPAGSESPRVFRPVRADTSPPLAELVTRPRAGPRRTLDPSEKPREVANRLLPGLRTALRRADPTGPRRIQLEESGIAMPGIGLSFPGYGNADNTALGQPQVLPPDPNGDVGPAHYVQYMNLGWRIFSRESGAAIAGPFAGNVFWTGFGGPCEQDNAGDAIVLHDDFADRWLFAQFAEPLTAGTVQCFAVSTGPDPLGPYHRYELAVPFLDYPKLGIYTDGAAHSTYALTGNSFGAPGLLFSGVTLAAIDRDRMLAGDPTLAVLVWELPPEQERLFFTVQPPHLDGPEHPRPGTCPPFVMAWDDEIWAQTPASGDGYLLWRLCPAFDAPAAATLSGPTRVDAGEEFDMELCGFADCVPQAGTAQRLDALGQFTMYRAALRSSPVAYPGRDVMAVVTSVDVGDDRAGIRWALLDVGEPALVLDSGTYAPGTVHRWVPSAALDRDGSLAVGYSRSAEDEFPSLQLAGRSIQDPPGVLREEVTCVAGGGAQTGGGRWVDYASMSVDPVDACTFWFTSEYYPATSARGWATRVCTLRFPDCGARRVLLRAADETVRQQACAGTPLAPVILEASLTADAPGDVTLSIEDPEAAFGVRVAPGAVVTPPATITVTATHRDAAAAGTAAFAVVGEAPGFAGGRIAVEAELFNPLAAAPTPATPRDGTLDAARRPTLGWSPVAGATGYRVELATDPDFARLASAVELTAGPWVPEERLAAQTRYYWRVVARNPCGERTSAVRQFVTAPPTDARVLLVDDDDDSPDVRAAFTEALNANGIPFALWDTGNSDDEPDAGTLAAYDGVLWFTGDEFEAVTGPSPASEEALATYLDAGGCLLLSSQDYAFRVLDEVTEPSVFQRTYLGAGRIAHDVGFTRVEGAGLFAGLEETELDYRAAGMPPAVTEFNDELAPVAGAVRLFTGLSGVGARAAAVGRLGPEFHSAWLGFPLATLPPEDRLEIVRRFFVEACGVLAGVPLGELAGRVRLAGSGAPLPGAEVRAERAGITYRGTTDEAGRFSLATLPAGFFQVVAGAPRAEDSALARNVTVDEGATTALDFALDAAEAAPSAAAVALRGPRGQVARRSLTLSNPGTRVLQFAAEATGYALGGEPALAADGRGPAPVLAPSSRGATARVTAAEAAAPTAPAAPGSVLTTAPYPGDAPLGITMAPDGTIWVADLFSGRTAVYDENLFLTGSIDDPIGTASADAPTTGIAYDPLADTLWWLASGQPMLVEGARSGEPTGRTIALTVPEGGLASGVEYDPGLNAFFYLDIRADDIWAVDRAGTPLPGYPVPQTDLDRGQGLFGNGLDVVDGKLEVLVGEEGEREISRAVLTDRLGNDLGVATSLTGIPDNFVNDVVRSRLEPDRVLYLVGNASTTVYAVEPESLLLTNRWARVIPASGTVDPGATSAPLELTIEALPALPFGEYSAALAFATNAPLGAAPVTLGLVIEGSPALQARLSAYPGADNGAGCRIDRAERIDGLPGSAVTLCLRLDNRGDTHLAEAAFRLEPLGLARSDWTLQAGAEPLAPGERARFFRVVALDEGLDQLALTASARATDGAAQAIPGPSEVTARATFSLRREVVFASGFE